MSLSINCTLSDWQLILLYYYFYFFSYDEKLYHVFFQLMRLRQDGCYNWVKVTISHKSVYKISSIRYLIFRASNIFSPRDNNEQKHELLKYHKFITVKSNFQLTTIDSKYKTTAEVSICGMAFGLYRFLTKSNTCCGRQLTMQFLRYTTFGEGGWSKQWFVRAVSLTVMTLFTSFGTALFLGLFWKLMS